jgi:hypothetical protein
MPKNCLKVLPELEASYHGQKWLRECTAEPQWIRVRVTVMEAVRHTEGSIRVRINGLLWVRGHQIAKTGHEYL